MPYSVITLFLVFASLVTVFGGFVSLCLSPNGFELVSGFSTSGRPINAVIDSIN